MPLTILDPTVAPAPKIAIISLDSCDSSSFSRVHTSIAKLLAELLATLLKFALLSRITRGVRGRSALADLEGYVPIVGGWRGIHRALFANLIHIASGEDALHTGALVATAPP